MRLPVVLVGNSARPKRSSDKFVGPSKSTRLSNVCTVENKVGFGCSDVMYECRRQDGQ